MNSRKTLMLGGLLLLTVGLAACSSSASPSSPTPTPTPTPNPNPNPVVADVVITITGMNGSQSFSPNPSAAVVGQTVAFINADSIVHTATADNGSFDTGNIGPGAASAPITLTAAGAFSYHCKIHPTMVGTLNVTP